MKKNLCIILAGALLLALCVSPGSASGLSGTGSLPFYFPLTLKLKTPALDKTTAVIGETLTATWMVDFGSPPYDEVHSFWILDNASMKHNEQYANSSAEYVNKITIPPGTVTVQFFVEVRDGMDYQINSSSLIIVSKPEPLMVEFTWLSNYAQADSLIEMHWNVVGGVPPYVTVYTYWNVITDGKNDPRASELSSPEGTRSFIPTDGDEVAFVVMVQDAVSNYNYFSSFPLVIYHPKPVMFHMKLSKSAVTLGDEVWGDWEITGGNPPYQEVFCDWKVSSGGKGLPSNGLIPVSAKDSISYRPDKGDKLRLFVSVNDAGGYISSDLTDYIPILQPLGGDGNQDGTVDILDLVSIIDYIVSNTDPTSLTNANANGKGGIDILDLVWIIDEVVGN